MLRTGFLVAIATIFSASAVRAQGLEQAVELHLNISFLMNTLLMLLGGFLVFWMAAGFAMLEAGLVRSKNVAQQLTKNVGLYSLACIFYFVFGFNLMYPDGFWAIDGMLSGKLGLPDFGATSGREEVADFAQGSQYGFVFFQMMFCATTASIASGVLAERIKLWPFFIFVILFTGIIYPIQASWVWGGGFLADMGFRDFAGGAVVHVAGGVAALTGAILLGPRLGKYQNGKVYAITGSNLPIATLGVFILWLGWFGFNGASQLVMGSIKEIDEVAKIFLNTNVAGCGGAIAALLVTQFLYKNADLTMVLNGALAGLVAITADPLAPSVGGAAVIGALGGIVVVHVVPLLDRLKIDDAVGALAVHLFGGCLGIIAAAFTNPETLLITQLMGLGIIIGFVFVVTFVLWFVIKMVAGLRVSEQDELNGLDLSIFGFSAYDTAR